MKEWNVDFTGREMDERQKEPKESNTIEVCGSRGAIDDTIDKMRDIATIEAIMEAASVAKSFASGDTSGARSHCRAFRAWMGAVTGKNLLTNAESEAVCVAMVCSSLAFEPCSDDVRTELLRIADISRRFGVDVGMKEDVVRRAYELINCGRVQLDAFGASIPKTWEPK